MSDGGDMSERTRDLPPPRIGVRAVVVAALFAAGLMGAGPMAAMIGDHGSCDPACVDQPDAPQAAESSPEPTPDEDADEPSRHDDEPADDEPAADEQPPVEPDPEVQEAQWKLDAKIVEVTPPIGPNGKPDCLIEAQVLTRNVCLP